MKDDDDLIITNNQEESVEVEEIVLTDDGEIKEAAPDALEEKSFKQILDENIHEEDAPLTASSITLIKVLGGDFFSAQIIRRQIWLILLISAFAIVYISNRYSCQKSQLEVDKLTKELTDAKYKVLSTNSELTERSRESNVLQVLKECGDSAIHISDEPPYLINIEGNK